MTNRDLITEVCHELINRAMRHEDAQAEWGGYRETDDRRKEAALRLALEVVDAAMAVTDQPMLRNGDKTTWGDVAQSQVEGPRLLKNLMTAVDNFRKDSK